MEKLTDNLFDRWQNTCKSFSVDRILMKEVFTHLVTAYSSPNRYYHNLEHIDRVLREIDLYCHRTQKLNIIQFAAWFHDAIYDSQAKDNEEKSAEYADRLLKLLTVPEEKIAIITRLILNTKRHQAYKNDLEAQILLDADLAILGTDAKEYQIYCDRIRQEYAWVSESKYSIERRKVLEQFLQRDRIYIQICYSRNTKKLLVITCKQKSIDCTT